MDYRGVLSNANKLKKSSLYKITIADSTKELLTQINRVILDAHDAGLSKVEFKLPLNFRSIDNNITNDEIQTVIYFNIVTELERMGYEVRLIITKKSSLLIISWVVRADNNDITDMKRKLFSLTQ